MPARAPPIIGRKSTSATHSAHSSGNGTPSTVRSTKTTIPQMIEVRKFPSMYPMTERFTSDAIACTSSAWRGESSERTPRRSRGPSRSSSSTRMKMVSSSMSSDSAPLPTASAGAEMFCPNVTSFASFFCTHCCTW